jgi:predicted ATPase
MLPPHAAHDFIDRTSELDEISAFLDDVRGGPAALVVEGPAGIGKTSLLDAGLTLARSHEYRVLVSRPTEAEASLSFAGLGDLFEDALDEVSAELPDPQREALEVVLMRREAEDLPPSELAVSLGVRGVIAALAVNTPVIVSVDDLQWLDPSSARFLDFALRRLRSARVGLLGSVRSDERPGLIPSLEQAFPDGRVHPAHPGSTRDGLHTIDARADPRLLWRQPLAWTRARSRSVS